MEPCSTLPSLPREIEAKIFHLVKQEHAVLRIQTAWRRRAMQFYRVVRRLEKTLMSIAKRPVEVFSTDLFIYRDRDSTAYLDNGYGNELIYPNHLFLLGELMEHVAIMDDMANHLPIHGSDEDPLFIGTLHCSQCYATMIIFQRHNSHWSRHIGRSFTRRWRSSRRITLREHKRFRYAAIN